MTLKTSYHYRGLGKFKNDHTDNLHDDQTEFPSNFIGFM